MTTISINSVTEFIGRAISPLTEQLANDDAITQFVKRLGWELPSAPPSLLLVHDSAVALQQALGNLSDAQRVADDAGIVAAFSEVGAAFSLLVGSLEDLESALQSELPASFLAESGIAPLLKRRIVDSALLSAIRSSSYMSRAVLVTLGVIEENRLPPDPNKHQPAFTLREFRTDRLRTLLQDPSAVLADVYGWGTPEIDAERLYRSVNLLSFGLLAPAEPAFASTNLVNSMFANAPSGSVIPRMLNIPLGGVGGSVLEVAVFPAPKASPNDPQPLAFRLVGNPQGSLQFGIGLGVQLTLAIEAALDTGIGMLLRPGEPPELLVGIEGPSSSALTGGRINITVNRSELEPFRALELQGLTLDISDFRVGLALEASPADLTLSAAIEGAKLAIELGEADGLIRSSIPGDSLSVEFDIGIGWSKRRGIFITGSAGLETLINLNLTIGPVLVEAIRLAVLLNEEGLNLQAGFYVSLAFGPVTAVVIGIGVEAALEFKTGNLGPMDLSGRFLPPNGLGILVDAGPIRGGGFLSLDYDAGRYSGALELSVFGIAVKAFGLIDTKFPDGREGFSFVVIIVAEFTPIQLGFGFTLIGVGGLLGINRSVNEDGLATAVRTGSLEHLLFPRNPVRDAPAIVHDLGTVFPATRGHTIFGPLGKLGWGTPTLISADIGIIIEFPGPRLGLLGVVRMALPSPETALLRLQMAIGGFLDFPGKRMSLNASLYDSNVVGFAVSGDMAYRLNFGRNAKFLLSVGGFNPSFNAPPETPDLRRASVNLGVNGNPSLVASGYFALTSNTAQFGASIELNARGGPARLHGWMSYDALFVFSPFSFMVSFSAGMRVSVWGKGIGVTLRGDLSGPSPWHVKGKVCVSLLFKKACVSVDHKFGRREPAALPEMDPWVGTPPETDPRIAVRGLRAAIQDARSWSGSSPPAGFAVVSLAAAATAERTPIDPLGAATLRQRVAPLNMKLEKFGEYRPIVNDQFNLTSVVMNGESIEDDERENVEDDFAPGHFMELSNSEKLTMESYEPMDAGFSIAPDRLDLGSVGTEVLEYTTKLINDEGQVSTNQPPFTLTAAQLRGLLGRSAAARGGVRASGTQKYVVLGRARKVTLGRQRFVVVNACTSIRNTTITPDGVSQVRALLALRNHVAANPADAGLYRVAPLHEAKEAA